MGSDNYISDISDLFIAQFDSGYMNSVGYYVRNNIENPHMQLLFTGFESANGAGWLPSNTEVEIPIDGLSLSPDKEQIMAVSYTDNSQANYGLYFNYSSCVNSPEYQDGMECQIRYANLDVPIFYVPVVPEEPATPAPETDIYEDEGYGNASGDSSGHLVEVVPTPKTPNTGVASEECTKKVDFPWWLMALMLLGDVIAVWWFLPNHKRK